MKTSIIVRFVVAAILVSAGCALMLAGFYRGAILFGMATIFYMPRSELTKPIPRREFWIALGVLLALFAVGFTTQHLLPSSTAVVIQHVACHPAFVVPFWLLMLWGLSRHYRRQKEELMPNHSPEPSAVGAASSAKRSTTTVGSGSLHGR